MQEYCENLEIITLDHVKNIIEKYQWNNEYIEKYIQLEKKEEEKKSCKGKFFSINSNEIASSVSGHGMSYWNAYTITDDKARLYCYGPKLFRSAYGPEKDDWDAYIANICILEEKEKELVYAIKTGTGDINIFRFSKKNAKKPEIILTTSLTSCKKWKKKEEALKNANFDSLYSYIDTEIGRNWDLLNKVIVLDKDIAIAVTKSQKNSHTKIYVWIRNKGIGTMSYLVPNGNFSFDAEINKDKKRITIKLNLEKIYISL